MPSVPDATVSKERALYVRSTSQYSVTREKGGPARTPDTMEHLLGQLYRSVGSDSKAVMRQNPAVPRMSGRPHLRWLTEATGGNSDPGGFHSRIR